MRKLRMFIIALATVGAFLAFASNAFAGTQHASILNRCGGVANTKAQLIHNWDRMGATGSVSHLFGIQPVNETLASRVNSTFRIATLSATATVRNFGCSGGAVKSAGNKKLRAGTRLWIDVTPVRAKFGGAFSLSAKKGFKRVAFWVPSRAQSSCSNPIAGLVRIWVWINVTKTPPKPAPNIPVTGNCSVGSIVIIGNNNTVNVCVVVVTCGNAVVQFGTMEQAWQYIAENKQCTNSSTPPSICQCQVPPPSGCSTCTPPPGCTQNCNPCTVNCNPCTVNCAPCTQNCTPPKDGTQGPGAGTPGQSGGPGAGGSPGPGAGPMCRDDSGNPVPGTPDPATGNCPGVTNSGTSGGPSTTGPPPPPPAMCIDPVTLQQRPGTADQFGYCT